MKARLVKKTPGKEVIGKGKLKKKPVYKLRKKPSKKRFPKGIKKSSYV